MSVTNTHFGAAGTEKLLKNCRSVFFIGIGGINMSSLALITHRRGYKVGGSDRTLTSLTDKLAADGIEIFEGHSAENLDGYDAPSMSEQRRRGSRLFQERIISAT